jgi:hypothetical protein
MTLGAFGTGRRGLGAEVSVNWRIWGVGIAIIAHLGVSVEVEVGPFLLTFGYTVGRGGDPDTRREG